MIVILPLPRNACKNGYDVSRLSVKGFAIKKRKSNSEFRRCDNRNEKLRPRNN